MEGCSNIANHSVGFRNEKHLLTVWKNICNDCDEKIVKTLLSVENDNKRAD